MDEPSEMRLLSERKLCFGQRSRKCLQNWLGLPISGTLWPELGTRSEEIELFGTIRENYSWMIDVGFDRGTNEELGQFYGGTPSKLGVHGSR
jgi:hypothetical protein